VGEQREGRDEEEAQSGELEIGSHRFRRRDQKNGDLPETT
jgi:hypothetical protein